MTGLDVQEQPDGVYIVRGRHPLLKLDDESDAQIIEPARRMPAGERNRYLSGILDGYAKRKRDTGF